jgi:hypothetical protein
MERLRAIWRCPSSASYFKRKTSLILRMDNLLAGKLTSRWEANLPCDVQHRSPWTPVEPGITDRLRSGIVIAFDRIPHLIQSDKTDQFAMHKGSVLTHTGCTK